MPQRPLQDQLQFRNQIESKNSSNNPPIYQSLPQINSSPVYATQNQIYSNLQSHRQIQTPPPPIYSNFSSPEFNIIEPETYLAKTNLQGEASRLSPLDSTECTNTHAATPIFGGLSKRIKNVFHGLKI